MSATIRVVSPRATQRRPFYLGMSMLLAAIAIAGFSRTIPSDLAAPGFPALLWLHGMVFTAWVLLFIAQPALVMGGAIRAHRRLGWAGAALACAMIALGAVAILMALLADKVPPFYPHGLFIMRGAIGLASFAGLVTAGVLNRKRPEWHKRLLLCASIIVVLPGLERAMPLYLFGANWPYAVDATIDLIALAGPARDLAMNRRVHPAYLWGIGTLIGGQVLIYATANSVIARSLLHALGTR